ncbi:hypothetical protein QUF72_12310 [Desulfobacterales bacterium HSG2]|nr:hypothetical protein [Desulfobacterales bacterium HSG2]
MKEKFCFITSVFVLCGLFFFSALTGVSSAQIELDEFSLNTVPVFVNDFGYSHDFTPSIGVEWRVDGIEVESTLRSSGGNFRIEVRVIRAGGPDKLVAAWNQYVSNANPVTHTHTTDENELNNWPKFDRILEKGDKIRLTYRVDNPAGGTGFVDESKLRIYSDSDYVDEDTGLRVWAVIDTEEKGRVDAAWRFGGRADNIGGMGHNAVWGHFYASPVDVEWGSPNNPDVFVKIWYDASGRIDVNFFHVSVPDIEVYSSYVTPDDDASLHEEGVTNLYWRYVRHCYEDGQSYEEANYEDGNPAEGYVPDLTGTFGVNIINKPTTPATPETFIGIWGMINIDQKGPRPAAFRLRGRSETPDGHYVIWGYFHADPIDVFWGDLNNPDLFFKIWFDKSGRIDVNFFHVSVPEIEVFSTAPKPNFSPILPYVDAGTTIMSDRYIRFTYP